MSLQFYSEQQYISSGSKSSFLTGLRQIFSKNPASGFFVYSSTPLSKKQQSVIGNLTLEPLKKNEAYWLDPRNFYPQYSLDIAAAHYVPQVLIISGRHDKLPFSLGQARMGKTLKPLPITENTFYAYALGVAAPKYAQTLVTDLCNISCVQCPFQSKSDTYVFNEQRQPRVKQHVDIETLKVFLQGVEKTSYFLVGGFGEPGMHPQLEELITLIKQHEMYVTLQTNGLLLTETLLAKLAAAGLDQIEFSIDSIYPDEYAAIRVGGSLDTVIRNLSTAKKMKESGQASWVLGVNYSYLDHKNNNDDAVKEFFTPYLDVLTFRVAFKDPYTEAHLDEVHLSKDAFPSKCYTMLSGPILGPDGSVYPCASIGNASWFQNFDFLKNINEHSLDTIWASYKEMLQDDASSLRHVCMRCTFYTQSFRTKGTENSAYFRVVHFSTKPATV